MSDVMHIKPGERGVVRLFALDLEPLEAREFDVEAVSDALGVLGIDAEQVDIVAIDDLDEIGLLGYLRDGMGIRARELAEILPRINALKGHVVLIRSAAFGGAAATLRPTAPLRWIASFGETPLDLSPQSQPLPSASARGTPPGATPAAPVSNSKTLYFVLGFFAVMILATVGMLIRITAS